MLGSLRELVLGFDPLLIAMVASVLMFLPLAAGALRLDGSQFAQFVSSDGHEYFLTNAISAATPLLLDLLLDLLHASHSEYLLFRVVSIFSLLFSLAMSLSAVGTSYTADYVLTFFVWGYFVEFGVIFSFMHHLIPAYFTWARTVLLLVLLFVFCFLMLLNSMSLASSSLLNVLFLVDFYLVLAVCSSLSTLWAISMWRKFVASKRPFLRWLGSLSGAETCAVVLTAALASQALLFLVLLNAVSTQFSHIASLRPTAVWIIESSRTFLCIFTYLLPSRLFRAKLLGAQRALDAKVEVVKYISHEFRTPLSILTVAMELVLAECRKLPSSPPLTEVVETVTDGRATCLSLVEVLDDLLLYENIERSSVSLCMSEEEPAAYLRQVLDSYSAEIAKTGTSVELSGRLDSDVRISVDRRTMKSVFNALLLPAIRATNASGPIQVNFSTSSPQEVAPIDGERSGSMVPSSQRRGGSDPSSPVLLLSVLDGRSGLRAEDLKHLDPQRESLKFERLGHEDGRGSGFSFWIARKVLALHKGAISVTLEAQAVRYQITLPLRRHAAIKPTMSVGHSFHATIAPLGMEAQRDTQLDSQLPNALREKQCPQVPDEDVPLVSQSPCPSTRSRIGELLSAKSRPCSRSPRSKSGFLAVSKPNSSASEVMRRHTFQPGDCVEKIETRGLNLLVVDDSAMNRRMIVRLMNGLGHRCTEAEDGGAAVAEVRRSLTDGSTYDVILMDNQMPVMLGIEATRVIKTELGYDGLVLGVTGNVHEDDVRDFIASGANAVIPKPLRREVFEEHLKKFSHLVHR